MHIHLSNKIKFAIVTFVVAFIVVMGLFIWKPNIVRSKNKFVRSFFVFAIAFIPGVMAASICAVTITTVWNKVFVSGTEIIMETEETKKEAKEEDDKEI